MTTLRSSIIILLLLTISSCSGSDKKKEAENLASSEEMYNDAMDLLEGRKYKKSIEKFEEIERTYPYSEWATKSQIMSAYANYLNEKYDDAIIVLDGFIKLHPGHKDTPYAYYLKALSYYEQISSIEKDQSYTELARKALKELIARFPDSQYAVDAKIKLDLVYDHLAGKEMNVGFFYEKQKDYIAAINRFKTVIENYQTTTHAPEALHRLVECYYILGITNEAEKYAAVLGHNYPGSKWYKRSYEILRGKAS